jgi:hypothetical protein
VTKYGEPSKFVDQRRKKKFPLITIGMICPTIPSSSTVKSTFDPTIISDKYLFDLHRAISKELARRWKKVLKEGSQVEKLKQEQKNILQEYREAVRSHEGI